MPCQTIVYGRARCARMLIYLEQLFTAWTPHIFLCPPCQMASKTLPLFCTLHVLQLHASLEANTGWSSPPNPLEPGAHYAPHFNLKTLWKLDELKLFFAFFRANFGLRFGSHLWPFCTPRKFPSDNCCCEFFRSILLAFNRTHYPLGRLQFWLANS